MKTIRTLLKLTFFTMGILLITADSNGQGIPSSWQPGMKITMTYGGGMRPFSDTVFISDAVCYYSASDEGKLTRFEFTLTQKELDALALFLRQQKFDKIRDGAKPTFTYDKGSTSILLQWGDQFAGAGTSASLELEDKQKANFDAVRIYLDELVATHSKNK